MLGFCSRVQRVNVVFNTPVFLAEVLPVYLCDAGKRDIDLRPRPWWKGHWARGVHGSGAQLNLRHLSPHQILQKQTQGTPLSKYLHVKKDFSTPGLQLLIFPIHLPRKYNNFLFYLLCCYPADGECGWDAGMERMCWHLRTAFTYRILSWCLVCHRWSFRYDTLTFVSFQHLQVQTDDLHIIPTDFHAVLDNHDIISLKLYQLTVQRSAEEEEEEVTIPRVDNINLFQGKNHPISSYLSDKADVIID